MNIALVGARYHVGEHILTLDGPGTIIHIDVDDESVFYHVKLDNNSTRRIFGGSQVIDIIKKELRK